MIRLLAALGLASSALAAATPKGDLACELTILPENEASGSTASFTVTLGKPEQGEFQGYAYYVTWQKTTTRAATWQVSRDDDFFLHGSSSQPDAKASFSALGFDGGNKNSIYLGCREP